MNRDAPLKLESGLSEGDLNGNPSKAAKDVDYVDRRWIPLKVCTASWWIYSKVKRICIPFFRAFLWTSATKALMRKLFEEIRKEIEFSAWRRRYVFHLSKRCFRVSLLRLCDLQWHTYLRLCRKMLQNYGLTEDRSIVFQLAQKEKCFLKSCQRLIYKVKVKLDTVKSFYAIAVMVSY